MAICMRYCKSKDEAEDVLLTGFYRIYRSINKYNDSGSFESWMKRIIINVAIDNYRKNKKYYQNDNCWKGTISNNGELVFSQIDCETLTSTEKITEPKHSEVFIYPNPTSGQITVEYTGNRKNLRLEIKLISGLLVATYKIKKGENRIELNNIADQMIVASVFTKKGELISTNKVVLKK